MFKATDQAAGGIATSSSSKLSMDFIAKRNLLGASLLHSGDLAAGASHFEQALRGVAQVLEDSATRDESDRSSETALTPCDSIIERATSTLEYFQTGVSSNVLQGESTMVLKSSWCNDQSFIAASSAPFYSMYATGAVVFSPDWTFGQIRGNFTASRKFPEEEVLTMWSAFILFNLALSRHLLALFNNDLHMMIVARRLYSKVGQTLDSLVRFFRGNETTTGGLPNTALDHLYLAALNNQGLLALDTVDYETTKSCFSRLHELCLMLSSARHDDAREPNLVQCDHGFFLLNAICFGRTLLAAAA